MNPLAEAEAEAKSPFLGQTEAEAEDSVDHWLLLKTIKRKHYELPNKRMTCRYIT